MRVIVVGMQLLDETEPLSRLCIARCVEIKLGKLHDSFSRMNARPIGQTLWST